jgi:hypothetical protein
MSVSEKARLDNIALALRLMMHDLGEPYGWQEHDAKTAKFEPVLRTTWEELAEQGLVNPRTFDRYELTGLGWIAGLKVTGAFEDDEFRRKAGLLQRALKARIKPENRTNGAAPTGLSWPTKRACLNSSSMTRSTATCWKLCSKTILTFRRASG